MLEHVNITVTDPEKTAAMLCDVFGWHVRWSGASALGGRTVHVGTDDSYVAAYTFDGEPEIDNRMRAKRGGLNHIGVEVDDLDATEQRVIAAGLHPHTHGDYEPGRRFYFDDADGIEYEVVSYG